jgi:TonB family protein
MLKTTSRWRIRQRSSAAFAGSALIHAACALLLLRMTPPQSITQGSRHFVPVYAPAVVARVPLPAPARPRAVPARAQTLAFPPSVTVSAPTPELQSVSKPEAPLPVPPRPRPVPPPEIEPGAIKLSSPVPRIEAFDSQPVQAKRQVSDSAALQVGKFEETARSLPVGERRGPIGSAGFNSAAGGQAKRASLSEGTVRFGSFGAAEALGPPGATPRAVTNTDFDSVDARTASAKVAAPDERFAALEILDKPRPLYSEEARKLKIEGVVVLEMSFGSDGRARVLRVIRGLGHGLDENAIRAAMGIRFHPAVHQGRSMDTVALVRIEFQVAY